MSPDLRRGAVAALSLVASLLLVVGVAALVWPQAFGGGSAFVMVSGVSMEPAMHTGDLAIVRQSSKGYKPGEIVAFRVPDGEQGAGAIVIHRVTGGNGHEGYVLQGDNKASPDPWRPGDSDVVGRRILLVPSAGHLVEGLRAPLPLAAVAGLGTMLIVVTWRPRRSPVASGTSGALSGGAQLGSR